MDVKMADKINGWGPVLRLVTPILVGINLAMVTYIIGDIKDFKKGLKFHVENPELHYSLKKDVDWLKKYNGITMDNSPNTRR